MAAISQTINNVLGGVSQQPDPVKLPGQVQKATNAYLDPTFGCTKRPGTQFIGKLGSNIPAGAKWFTVFRSQTERYIGCIYGSSLRVWDADTAAEATVNVLGSASNYISANNLDNIKTLTVNDYTFIVNGERNTSVNSTELDSVNPIALVVINQVSYNTTYGVDFLRDGDSLSQTQVYKASKLSVEPASWEVTEEVEADQGSCAFAQTASFVENGSSGTGLGFTLSTTCNPTLVTTKVPGTIFPVKINRIEGNKGGADYGFNAYMVDEFGYAENYSLGSYLYTDVTCELVPGDVDTVPVSFTARVEVRVQEWPTAGGRALGWHIYSFSKAELTSYSSPTDYNWEVGLQKAITTNLPNNFKQHEDAAAAPNGSTAGFVLEVEEVRRGEETIEYSYKSVYRTVVSLNNGGADWSVGDTVTVTMQGKDYTIKVEETVFGYSYESEASVTYTTAADTSSGVLDVSTITAQIVSGVNALSGYSAEPVGNVVVIERTDGRDFNLMTRGGTANSAMYGVKDTVNNIAQLPAQCKDGITLKISNSEDSDADDYYVTFRTEGGIPGQGSWVETSKPGVTTDFDPGTMPHVLERDTQGVFSFRPLTKEYDDKNYWAPRDAGDEESNPNPSFTNKPITDIVFYQNRLGFLSGESIVLSQAGDYFNFFQGSAIAISDADPIDLSVSTTKPAKLKAGVGTPSGLLLFAENSQFLLKSEEVAFGPATARLDEITSYAYRSRVQPLETGVSVLFPTSADTYAKVYELSVDSLNSRPLVSENTRIVPEYIPPNLTWGVSVPNQSLVMLGDGSRKVYTFKFYNTGNERNLAGWTEWIFNAQVKHVAFDHDTGFLVQLQSDGDTTLTRMELVDDPETSPIIAFGTSFTPRLDNYVYESQVTVIETPGAVDMRVNLPEGFYAGGEDVYVVATSDGTETFYQQASIQIDGTQEYVMVPATLKDTNFIVGIPFNFRVDLPTFFVKEGDRNLADRRFPPVVENLYLDLYYSGRYSVTVQKTGYADRTVDLDVIKSDLYLANTAAMENFATRSIPIFSRGDFATVKIEAIDPLPASLTSYSWEGHYNTRGISRR